MDITARPRVDDHRVLLLAPTRRDRAATLDLLERAGITAVPCESVADAAVLIDASVGAILMTDAALTDPDMVHLLEALSRQPSWSDIPIVLLCQANPPATDANGIIGSLHNVTLLERPTSSRTLLSSVQAALRARARQYELRHQFEALRATEAALREADQRKDLFLATLAHELRNPLAPIRTAAQVLASPMLAPPQLAWAQHVIQRQVAHMALLLDDLLDIARITQGKLELKRSRVALTEVVDSAVEAARPLIDRKRHQLRVTLPGEILTFDADPLRLSQVLSNLLTNAAKYTDPGGHIELSGIVHDGMLRLSVIDDGIGIAPESLPRIFGIFSQINDTGSRSDGGLGIGLSLVKGLLELHGGTIEAHSEGLGRGSRFTAQLPLSVDASLESRASEAHATPIHTARRRVMVADDNKDAADTLAMLLELDAHEVCVAYSGQTALSLARTFRPEIAFVDIGMPDLSGYEVARELRREPWGAGMRLVALTGWGQDEDRQRAKLAGFDRHVTKPVNPEMLGSFLREPVF